MITLLTQFGDACSGGNFLGFPTWYHYLNGITDAATKVCTPELQGLNDIWLIVAAIIEIMLRIAALVAVVFIIYGGFEYITSQAEPDKTKRAKSTIINAVVGLIIAIMASVIVNFIARSIH